MAYVMGVLEGDGFLIKHERRPPRRTDHFIGLKAKDKEFLHAWVKALREIGLRPSRLYFVKRERPAKDQWRVVAYSRLFYDWYMSLSWPEHACMVLGSDATAIAWLRGMYDSEGSFPAQRGVYRLSIGNGTPEAMDLTAKILGRFGFTFTTRRIKPGTGGTKWMIRHEVCGKQQTKRFVRLVRPTIPRKRGPFVSKKGLHGAHG